MNLFYDKNLQINKNVLVLFILVVFKLHIADFKGY